MFLKIASISFVVLFCSVSFVHSEKATSSDILKADTIETMNITFESNNYTLYGEIFYPSEPGVYPGIVFCEGCAGYVEAYSWISKALAEQGYVVFLYDFPGQGRSEGVFGFGNSSLWIPSLNFYLRSSAFFEVSYYYVMDDLIITTMDAVTYLTNESPVRNLVDSQKLGLIGHSIGGFTATETAVFDKRIDAVVALSQGNVAHAEELDVPVQFQAGCFDITWSVPITYLCYTKIHAPKELVTIQWGAHIGFTSAFGRYCLCPPWQKDICLRYAIGWFDYFLKNKPDAYENITTGTDHLSKIIRSRYNFGDGEHFLP